MLDLIYQDLIGARQADTGRLGLSAEQVLAKPLEVFVLDALHASLMALPMFSPSVVPRLTSLFLTELGWPIALSCKFTLP